MSVGRRAKVTDANGNPISSTGTALDVNLVSGDVTIENAELDVEVNAADGDNIAISDGTHTAAVTAANALKVDGSASTQPIASAAITSIDSRLAGGNKRVPAAPTSVTSSATQIVPANANRKALLIQNVGNFVAYLGKNNTITSSIYTVRLLAGAKLSDSSSLDAWFAINDGTNNTSLAWEEVS